MSPETIRERAGAIRFGNKQIAGASGLSEKSVGQILSGRSGGHHASFVAIETALEAEECRLRDYLLTLHPVKQEERAA